MRILLRMQIPTEVGNKLVQGPDFLKNIEGYMSKFNVEAAYFTETYGDRTAIYILDSPSTDQLATAVEPLFQSFNAKVEVHPAMNLDELKRAYQRA